MAVLTFARDRDRRVRPVYCVWNRVSTPPAPCATSLEVPMKDRFIVGIGTAFLIASIHTALVLGQGAPQVPKPAQKGWTPRLLSDGQPDIQGVWTNYDNTPF